MGWVVGPLPTDHEMLHPLPHQCSESLGHTGIPTADAAGKAPVGKDSSGNFSGQWSEAGLQGSLDTAMPGYRSWISPSPGGSNLRHVADLFSTVPQFLQLHNPDSNRPARWAVVRTLKMVFVKCSVEVGQRFGCRPLKQQAFSTHPCGARNGPSLRGPSLWLPLCFTSALSGRIVGGLGPPQKCLPGTALGSGGQPGASSWSSTSTLPAAGRSCVRSSGLSPQRRWCKHQASTANLDELGTSPWAGSLRSG